MNQFKWKNESKRENKRKSFPINLQIICIKFIIWSCRQQSPIESSFSRVKCSQEKKIMFYQ